jgi:predicted CXXCH cytochrome family protein
MVSFGLVFLFSLPGCNRESVGRHQDAELRAGRWVLKHLEQNLTGDLTRVERLAGCTSCHTRAETDRRSTVRACLVDERQSRALSSEIQPESFGFVLPAGAKPECLRCHDDVASRSWAHYPASVGLCGTCHEARPAHLISGGKGNVSTQKSEKACYSCHDLVALGSNVHPVMEFDDSCLNCHDPHGSSRRFFLPRDVNQVCQQCHDPVPDGSKSTHRATTVGKAWVNCHSPHASDRKSLLVGEQRTLCLSCHDRAIKSLVDHMPFVHEPTKGEDGCTVCHDPHASRYDRILKGNFPAQNYNKFSPGGAGTPGTYDLCLSCHPSVLNRDMSGSETRFRQDIVVKGKVVRKNLHWFHVVDAAGGPSKNAGRSCKVCHDPHGAAQPHMIRTSWKMGSKGHDVKVEFRATRTGGECARSCHNLRKYDRFD